MNRCLQVTRAYYPKSRHNAPTKEKEKTIFYSEKINRLVEVFNGQIDKIFDSRKYVVLFLSLPYKAIGESILDR